MVAGLNRIALSALAVITLTCGHVVTACQPPRLGDKPIVIVISLDDAMTGKYAITKTVQSGDDVEVWLPDVSDKGYVWSSPDSQKSVGNRTEKREDKNAPGKFLQYEVLVFKADKSKTLKFKLAHVSGRDPNDVEIKIEAN